MKKLLVGLAVSATIVATSPAFAWGNDCEYSRDVERELSLSESLQLNVVAGAGGLEVKGVSRDSVFVEAKLCAKTESQLSDMDITSILKGDVMHIETQLAKGRLWGTGSEGSYINLTVYVPKNAKLDVTDSSGEARIEGVESLIMVDSSGELTIKDISGEVRVNDSSGSLTIKQVGGNVWVTDSSGAIKARDITGDFTVEVDSSGGIEVARVDGSVLIRTDSSGGIEVNDIGGNFTVGNDSSGGIHHNNVAGEISLPN